MKFHKPRIIVSRCLGFDYCRYNGQIISSDFVDDIKPFVDFKTVCPEVEIGLGIPRDPIRIITTDEGRRLIQPNTDKDLTEEMDEYINNFIKDLKEPDGFILKNSSPSCGIKDVKLYMDKKRAGPVGKTNGFFGGAVISNFPYKAIETEGRLLNNIIREHFLTKIFTYSEFRNIKENGVYYKLKIFHDNNKYLLDSYNKNIKRTMDDFIKELDSQKINKNHILEYQEMLEKTFYSSPECDSKINTLLKIYKNINRDMTIKESKFFKDMIEDYKNAKIPFSVPLNILKSWIIRFNMEDLLNQSFLNPYPKELVSMETVNICNSRNFFEWRA